MQTAVRPLELPLRAPLRSARGQLSVRAGFVLELSEGGLTGRGEASPPVELGFDSVEAAQAALAAAAGSLSAASAPDSVAAVQGLVSSCAALLGSAAARHAVEQALLDLLAQRRGAPLSRVLAEDPRTRIAVNAILGADAGPDEAIRAVERGFGTLKLKVGGRAVAADVERVKAVRARVGRGVKLRVDANGAWTEQEAIRGLQDLARFELELCEQPTADADAMCRVRKAVRVPIAADESLALEQWRPALTAGNVDVVVLKPMVVGGLLIALELAQEAAFYDVGAYVTSSIDGEIARAGAAHLAAAIPQSRWAHGLATGELLATPDRAAWLTPSAGAIEVPQKPGLGLS